jgi:hypothetical protein
MQTRDDTTSRIFTTASLAAMSNYDNQTAKCAHTLAQNTSKMQTRDDTPCKMQTRGGKMHTHADTPCKMHTHADTPCHAESASNAGTMLTTVHEQGMPGSSADGRPLFFI